MAVQGQHPEIVLFDGVLETGVSARKLRGVPEMGFHDDRVIVVARNQVDRRLERRNQFVEVIVSGITGLFHQVAGDHDQVWLRVHRVDLGDRFAQVNSSVDAAIQQVAPWQDMGIRYLYKKSQFMLPLCIILAYLKISFRSLE